MIPRSSHAFGRVTVCDVLARRALAAMAVACASLACVAMLTGCLRGGSDTSRAYAYTQRVLGGHGDTWDRIVCKPTTDNVGLYYTCTAWGSSRALAASLGVHYVAGQNGSQWAYDPSGASGKAYDASCFWYPQKYIDAWRRVSLTDQQAWCMDPNFKGLSF
jgi:hypothetical protein